MLQRYPARSYLYVELALLMNELKNTTQYKYTVMVLLTIRLLMARHVVVVVVKSSSNGPKKGSLACRRVVFGS